MRYSFEHGDCVFVIGNAFLSFSQNPLYQVEKSPSDPLKTTSERIIQKTTEATVNFIDNKTENKITKLNHRMIQRLPHK